MRLLAGRIANANRGSFRLLNAAISKLTFILEIDVTSCEGIAETRIENTLKETIRQISATIELEEKE